jgi:hypothetical protein
MISYCWVAGAENPVRDARRDSGWISSEVKPEAGFGSAGDHHGNQLLVVSWHDLNLRSWRDAQLTAFSTG